MTPQEALSKEMLINNIMYISNLVTTANTPELKSYYQTELTKSIDKLRKFYKEEKLVY